MSWGVSPWVYPVWDSLGFLDLGGYFLPHFREVFSYYLLKYLLMAFLFVFFWDSYDSSVGHLTLSQRSLRLSSFLLILFFLFSSLLHLFPPFYLLPYLSYLLPQLFYCWFPPECFQSHLLHYSLLIDSSVFILGPCQSFLASSQSLSPVYLSVTPFCFQDFESFLLPLFWIIFR